VPGVENELVLTDVTEEMRTLNPESVADDEIFDQFSAAGNCLALGRNAITGALTAIGDTKTGGVLRFDQDEVAAFVAGAKAGVFDQPRE
jgi:hypothetical protein